MTGSDNDRDDLVNRVFGEAFAKATSDEWEPTSPEDEAERERWLRENIPPHHD